MHSGGGSCRAATLAASPTGGRPGIRRGAAARPAARKTKNVIYVTLDGFRWQELFGGAQAEYVAKDAGVKDVADITARYVRPGAEERREILMPFFWNVVAKRGQVFGDPERNARARITNTHKFSYPGYSEMFCGFADDEAIKSNSKTPNPHVTVLEFLHRRPSFDRRVAAFATWDVIPFILNRERSGIYIHAGTGPVADDPLTERQKLLNELIEESVVLWNGNGIDALTTAAAREHLVKHKPRVLYVGLGETDEWGHGRRYDLYLDAARKADTFLRRLWDLTQSLPEYKDQTSLVISTDHGRGKTIRDWTDHGAKVEDAEWMWMAVMGPDTPALGVRKDVEATQSQIAATLAHLVGEDFNAASPKSARPLPGVVEGDETAAVGRVSDPSGRTTVGRVFDPSATTADVVVERNTTREDGLENCATENRDALADGSETRPTVASDARTAGSETRPTNTKKRPNFVVVYADDLGYADLGCFGAKYATPHLDQMAKDGRRFTSFCVAQAVCSASRTALLTGCYPNRIGMLGALGPADRHGIHDDERTIAEALKTRGYACGVFGKWHLGHHPQFLPPRHGFDEYFGLPYSNDMWPQHPTAGKRFPALPLIEGDKVVNANVSAEDQALLTGQYAERAVNFIEKHRNEPFFLYVPHTMPHVPIFAGASHRGKSGHGPYADVIQEIDASVGAILAALRTHGLEENTLVVFTSDNGPWLSYGNHAGSAGPLREGKGTTWEGGVRVPCVMKWPGRVPRGTVCTELAATIDLLPTLAKLAGVDDSVVRTKSRPIDGVDIAPLLFDENPPSVDRKSPRASYWYYWGRELHAVRGGKWKLHFPHNYQALKQPGADGKPGPYEQRKTGLELYDLDADIGEKTNVADANPQIVEQLKTIADQAREDLGDTLTGATGKGVRSAGRLAE